MLTFNMERLSLLTNDLFGVEDWSWKTVEMPMATTTSNHVSAWSTLDASTKFLLTMMAAVLLVHYYRYRHVSQRKRLLEQQQADESLLLRDVSSLTMDTAPPIEHNNSLQSIEEHSKPVRFRRLRKSAASITGLHGVFSSSEKRHLKRLSNRRSYRFRRTTSITLDDEEEDNIDEDELQVTLRSTRSGPLQGASATSAPDTPEQQSFPICKWDVRPGTIGHLTAEQEQALTELKQQLAQEPLRHIAEHDREDEDRFLLRFLRATEFDVPECVKSLRDHSDFWHDFGIDDFAQEDEYRDVDTPDGLLFYCGRDIYNHPVYVVRLAVHNPKNKEDTENAVRRTVFTVSQAYKNLLPASDGMVLIYDCAGIRKMDFAFAKRIVSLLDPNFPDRIVATLVMNNSWAVQGLWNLLSPLLHPETREKIAFCGSGDYAEAKKWLPEDHPYLQRCVAAKQQKRRRGSVPRSV